MQEVTQQEIDFSRCQKYGILNRANLPKIAGVGAPLLTLLLHKIYGHSGDHGWCFASQDTLAKECRCKDRKQIGRAIKGLVEHFLVVLESRQFRSGEGRNVNHMRISWGNLAALAEDGHRDISGNPSGHSKGAIGTFSGGHRDMRVPLTIPNKKQPPPTSTPEAAAVEIDWKDAEQQLRAEGVAIASQLVAEAKAQGQTARDVLVVVHDYRANRSRLKSPGAIVTRLRWGSWPVEGVCSEASQKAKQEDSRRDRETKLIRAEALAIERASRRRGVSREDRQAELRQRIPADVLTVLAQDELKFVFE